MVSIGWAIAAFMAGGQAGALLMALLCIAGTRDEDGRARPDAPSCLRRRRNVTATCVLIVPALVMNMLYLAVGHFDRPHDAQERSTSLPTLTLAAAHATGAARSGGTMMGLRSVDVPPALSPVAKRIASNTASDLSFRQAVARAAPSVVTLVAARHPIVTDATPVTGEIVVALGSAVILDRDGYAITSGHLVEATTGLLVASDDGIARAARLIGADPDSDLALLKIDGEGLQPIEIADLDTLAVGDVVLAVGNPMGLGETVTQGIVSAVRRARTAAAGTQTLIQTDAAINPGNSGGALIDSDGRLVGINSAILSRSGGSEGIGFAIGADVVRRVAADLKTDGRAPRAPQASANATP